MPYQTIEIMYRHSECFILIHEPQKLRFSEQERSKLPARFFLPFSVVSKLLCHNRDREKSKRKKEEIMPTFAVDYQVYKRGYWEEDIYNDWQAVEAPTAQEAISYLRERLSPDCSIYGALELAEDEED